eukprot:TRINITY_DN3261_c0_g1_i2.p1 TRINITY_DN3261_c0_g1~~TRINITY_DN3261_c0_g1_i2.p1  ORF type:complete len:412 (-),score=70.80 TRINITY_DN3261_c0_g1_i2:1070-2305(-)
MKFLSSPKSVSVREVREVKEKGSDLALAKEKKRRQSTIFTTAKVSPKLEEDSKVTSPKKSPSLRIKTRRSTSISTLEMKDSKDKDGRKSQTARERSSSKRTLTDSPSSRKNSERTLTDSPGSRKNSERTLTDSPSSRKNSGSPRTLRKDSSGSPHRLRKDSSGSPRRLRKNSSGSGRDSDSERKVRREESKKPAVGGIDSEHKKTLADSGRSHSRRNSSRSSSITKHNSKKKEKDDSLTLNCATEEGHTSKSSLEKKLTMAISPRDGKSERRSIIYHLLSLRVIKAEGLTLPETETEAFPSPYLKLTVKLSRGGTKINRTSVEKLTGTPKWTDQLFAFESPLFPVKCQVMSKTAKDKDDILLGQFSIDVQHIGQPDIPVTKSFKFRLKHDHDLRGRVSIELVLSAKQLAER